MPSRLPILASLQAVQVLGGVTHGSWTLTVSALTPVTVGRPHGALLRMGVPRKLVLEFFDRVLVRARFSVLLLLLHGSGTENTDLRQCRDGYLVLC